jgi:glyoxylase-like metal-dependent hydrolase (beta-lactamase superfamily II)
MRNNSFNFSIGTFDCQVFSDGTIKIPPDRQMAVDCLFIKAGESNILIDSGEGKGVQPTSGHLIENMQAAGICPADVGLVILTHSHLDHVGGLVDEKGQPTYSNARYIMYRKEWDLGTPSLRLKPGDEEKGNLHSVNAAKKIAAVRNRFDVSSGESDIIPGIKYVPAPGHTPGNAMVVVSSGKESLFCLGDIMHHPDELNGDPGFWARLDGNAEEAARSRAQIVSRAADAQALIFSGHFSYPGVGHIVKKGGRFLWEPM